MKRLIVLSTALLIALIACIKEQPMMVVAAGTGQAGFKDGFEAELNKPIRFTPYAENSIIFADINNHAIRIASIEGEVTTIAGGPDKEGYEDGPASLAKFKSPHGVAYDHKLNQVYVAGASNHVIRIIHLSDKGEPQVTTLAGTPGIAGFRDGPVDSAMFNSPHALALGNNGEVIVADIGNARVRMIKDGVVSTLAGTGEMSTQDGVLEVATFNYAMDLVMDGPDILLADAGSHLIRKIVVGKEVTTVALQDTLSTPHGIAIDSDKNVYIADMGTHRILKIDPKGALQAIAGTGKMDTTLAALNKPAAVLVHGDNLWIADLNNHQIKVLPLK
jgi:DNA-binding beta-propeller fold protein YncE